MISASSYCSSINIFKTLMKSMAVFILLVLYSQKANAQKTQVDTLVINQLKERAKWFVGQKEYDTAISYFKKYGSNYRDAGDWDNFFQSQFQIGYYLNVQRKYSEAVHYLDSVELLFSRHLQPSFPSFQRFYGVVSWAYFSHLSYDKALHYFDLLITNSQENESVGSSDKIYANYYKGIIYQRIGQYDLALKQMRVSQNLCSVDSTCSLNGNIYNNLGIIYRNLGEYKRSKEFYLKALDILSKTQKLVSITPIYNNLGKVYFYLEEYDEALKELDFALNVLTSYTSDYYQVESALINTKAKVLIAKGNFDMAQEILDKVHQRELDKDGKEGPNSSETLYNLGLVYSKKEEFVTSNTYLDKSIAITQQYMGIKNDKSAEMIILKGNNYLNDSKYLKAAQAFQLAINSLVLEFNEEDLTKNPALESTILDRAELVEALFQKANVLLQMYFQSNDSVDLLNAASANREATQLLEYVRNSLLYESSKIRLSKKSKLIYEQAIEIALLQNDTKTSEAQVFSAMENSKSYLLASSLNKAKSLGYSNQSSLALVKEDAYKTTIKLLENSVLSATRNKLDSSTRYELKANLFEVKEELELFSISEESSNRSNLWGNQLSLELVKSSLLSNELVIEYFAGKSTLYALAISNEKSKLYKLGAYKKSVKSYKESIHQGLSPNDFQFISAETYSVILGPILLEFSSVEKLIIIPDRQLGYIAFDALITKISQTPSFLNLGYLIRKYTIFQHQTVGLLLGEINENQGQNGFIGFAPDFDENELQVIENRLLRNNLQPLPFAKNEVETIYQLLGGGLEIGSSANEGRFKSEVPKYNIIHVASHAIIDENNPLNSKLVFASTDSVQIEDGDLYSFEIYSLNLNCNLVTLSACNTGTGKYFDGEGIFSLGRAFLMAGASSVLTSLWEVADQSTSEIMESFYRNLKNGDAKPEAIRKAKITYLNKADELTANPYYWAGFVYTGDSGTVYSSNRLYYWLGGALFLLIIIFALLGKSKRANSI